MGIGKNTVSVRPTSELIFQFLVDYKRQHDGNTPSTHDLAEGCSVSISTANYHLTQLQLKNRIRILEQRPRQIEIMGGTWGFDSQEKRTEAASFGEDSTDARDV